MSALPLTQILSFSAALWLGLVLLGRKPRKPGRVFAGLGLVSYALGTAR